MELRRDLDGHLLFVCKKETGLVLPKRQGHKGVPTGIAGNT